LNAIAFQAYDIFKTLEKISEIIIKELKDEGVITNSEPLIKF